LIKGSKKISSSFDLDHFRFEEPVDCPSSRFFLFQTQSWSKRGNSSLCQREVGRDFIINVVIIKHLIRKEANEKALKDHGRKFDQREKKKIPCFRCLTPSVLDFYY
jgi:hypothetical protein